MSEITILHLSDIHFKKKKDDDNDVFRQTVQERLIEAVTGHSKKQGNPDFVAITGDIAFSGKQKEYDEALTFLLKLKVGLPGETEFLAVPGNHDVDREQIDEFFSLQQYIVRKDLIDKFLENEKKVKNYINVKVKAYRGLIQQLNPGLYQLKEDYFWVKNYMEKNVAFLGLNSAWACEGDHDRFNIALGPIQLTRALEKAKACTNKILLMHHPPFDWLKDLENQRPGLFKNIQLLLHGHTHSDHAHVFKDPDHACLCLGANASYTDDKEGFIGFQFIKVDFPGHGAGAAAAVWPYILDDRRKVFVPDRERYNGQDGRPFFEIDTFTPFSVRGKPAAPVSLATPADYIKWIEEFHSVLPVEQLARKGEVVLISLPAVYIALETANPFYKPMADEHKLEKKADKEPDKVPQNIAIEELLGKWICLLLRGNAGTGKTTLIKHLAYSLTHGPVPGPLNGYLPVMVFLKGLWPLYKNALRENAADITFETLLAAYLEKFRCPLPGETIDAYLARGRALFLIDGLDEVPDENRTALVDMVHRFQFRHGKNRFLITGRPHGVEGQAMQCFGNYLRDIEPLAGQKVGEFINRWFRAVSGQARGLAEVNAADMISEINLNEHAAVFTGNPLLLTALCVFYLVGGKRIPDQRADLYDRIVGNLLYRRFHDPADTDKVDKVREYLMNLAFTMHAKNIKSIEPCDARDILRQKEHYPALEGESPHEYKKRIEGLFNGIEPDCGLLNRLSSGEIEFSHLTFQEFLAAKQLLDKGMDYKPYLENPWWKETLLLYLGLMNLDMKKPSNDIACEIIKNYSQPRIQLIGTKALQDFQATRREDYAIIPAREKLLAIIESAASAPPAPPSLEERFEAGEILGHLGDPRIDVLNPPMVLVEAGKFTMGSEEYDDEKPVHKIELTEFEIGKYPVTNTEFKAFMLDHGYENKEYWTPEGWQWRQENNISEPGLWHDRKWNGPNFPVVGVSWYEAAAYAVWLSAKTHHKYQLPTEAQWEKAARGSRGFRYPWGDKFDKNKCNSAESGLHRTSPVGIFPSGKSPYGGMDMAGNVWEWCADWYESNYYKESPKENPPGPARGSGRVLRGGGWIDGAPDCRAACRLGNHPAFRGGGAGFRLSRLL
ncbi:MAG: hypothetical protein QG657_725 [Acidobacteriota bacterium]|nr:hypothetical protein [Acidobacteriota bacterium]